MEEIYGSLSELVNAVKGGAHREVTAWLDNDNVSFMDGDHELLALHPDELQEQALGLLAIHVERV